MIDQVNIHLMIDVRVNALNSGIVLNNGNRPLYTMMGHFGTIGLITN